MFKAAKQNRIFQDVVEQIQETILSGKLTPGEMLPPERELKEMLQVSRGTLREALRVLENKGLIAKSRLENDKRSYILQLSPQAKRLLKRINNWQSDLVAQISKFPTKEKEIALGFFTQLIKYLFDSKVISIARMCLTCENIIIGSENKPHVCRLTGRNFHNDSIEIDCDNFTSIKAV